MKTLLLAFAGLTTFISCSEKTTDKEVTTKIDCVAVAVPDTTKVSKVISDAAPPRTPVDEIKKHVAWINNAELRSERFDFMCDEKAYIVYHYNGDNIAKLTIDWGTVGDAYHREEFYFKDGKLIFEYDLLEGAGAYPGGDKKLERRHYVENDKVIRYMENQAETPCEHCEYKTTSVPYKALAAKASKDFTKALCQ